MNHWASSVVYGRLIDLDGEHGECVCREDFMMDKSGKKCFL